MWLPTAAVAVKLGLAQPDVNEKRRQGWSLWVELDMESGEVLKQTAD
jgi:hypothetical protein